jgi:hypothetical protein
VVEADKGMEDKRRSLKRRAAMRSFSPETARFHPNLRDRRTWERLSFCSLESRKTAIHFCLVFFYL